MKLSLVCIATLAFAASACSDGGASPMTGDDQNQTESQWQVTSIGTGPYPFDVLGSARVTAARASDGTLFAAFQDKDSYLSLSTRSGSQWTTEVVKSDGRTGSFASIAVDASKAVRVVHYDETVSGLVESTRAAGTTQWTHTTILKGASQNRLHQASDGTLHLVAIEIVSGALQYGTKKAGGTWAFERVGTGANYTDPAFALDEKGNPHISAGQFDAPGGKLVIADKTSSWQVASTGLQASYSSDLVVVGGVTHLAYSTPSNNGYDGALMYAKRTEGGVWSTPEPINWTGWDPDLVLDASGQPVVVASVDGYVQVSTRTASGGWTKSSVSSSQGNISPFFVPGSNDVVFTNKWSRGFSFATPKVQP